MIPPTIGTTSNARRGGDEMVFYRALLDELHRDDQFCDCCGMGLRARMIEAAQQGDRNWIFCQECRGRWTPGPDVNEAARGWVLVLLTGDPIPVAFLCAHCAASDPEPATMPSIARLVLSQSRGPLQ